MFFFAAVLVLSSFTYQQFGIYVIRLNSREWQNRLFLLLCFLLAVWTMSDAFMYSQPVKDHLFFFYKLSSAVWSYFPAIVLDFIIVLTLKKSPFLRTILPIIIIIPGLLFSVKTITGTFIVTDFLPTKYGWALVSDTKSIWYILYQYYYLSCLVIGIILVTFWGAKTRLNREKKQAQWIFVTGIIAYGLGFLQYILLSWMRVESIPAMQSVFILVWIYGIWRAISRYDLMILTPEKAAGEIINSMKDIMILVNQDQRIIKINRQTEVLLGLPERDLLGMTISHLVDVNKSPIFRNDDYLYQGTIEHIVETDMRTSRGELIPSELKLTVILDRANEPIGCVIVAHDLREMKLLEMEIEVRQQVETDLRNTLEVLKERNDELDYDLKFAQKIQQNYIPSSIHFNNIGVIYKATEKVGGDLYDIIRFPESDKIGIFISDVSGHGVTAAMITSMIKGYISQAGEVKNDPSALLDYLNHLLCDHIESNFVTAFYGIYNPVDHTLTYSIAGHNMPFMIFKGKITMMDDANRGVPLAVMSRDEMTALHKSYENRTIELKKPSKLLIYTDGLVEAGNMQNPNLCFEDGLLQEVMTQSERLSPQDFAEMIYYNLIEFHGNDHFTDDVCYVCLQV